jgi:hypothetical protein
MENLINLIDIILTQYMTQFISAQTRIDSTTINFLTNLPPTRIDHKTNLMEETQGHK